MKKGTFYTIGSVVILFICVIAFILPTTMFNGKSQNTLPAFGKYNGKEIRYEQGSDFANYVSQYGQMFQNQGANIDSSAYYYIFSYAFNATVNKLASKDAVKKSGYEVPESAVNRKMLPYFYDENGKYSSKLYKQTPAATVSELKTAIQNDLYAARYYNDIFGSSEEILGTEALFGIKESQAELDFLASYGNTKRGFNMIAYPMDNYPAEEKAKYGKANSSKFIEYKVSIITCSDKSVAEKASKRIDSGEITFKDAVSEYSDKMYSDSEGKISVSYQYQIESLLENKDDINIIAKLNKDEKSDVLKMNNGYAIFYADDKSVAPDFENDEIISTVGNYLTSFEKSIIEDYFISKANDFVSTVKVSNFDKACDKFNLEKFTVAPFPLNYGGASIADSVPSEIQPLSGAATNDNFLKTAFSMKLNETSDPLVLNNNIVVLQFTTEEKNSENSTNVLSQISEYDETSLTDAIMQSPKFENNFAEVYYKYMME